MKRKTETNRIINETYWHGIKHNKELKLKYVRRQKGSSQALKHWYKSLLMTLAA